MRVVIAGSRSITSYLVVASCIERSGFQVTTVVSGTARGVDLLGEGWAALHGVPIVRYPADWETYGKSAGYRRNIQMAENADAVIVIWDGQSKGSMHMAQIAKERRIPLKVFKVRVK
jgi:hypothetical protein